MNIKKCIAWASIGISLMASMPTWSDVVMGIFPRRPIAVTHKAFKPLKLELEKILGEKVIMVIPKNFKAFWTGVKAKKYDLVHYNQYHYIKSHKEYGYKVIITNEERGSKVIRGQLTVRKDSGIKSISDLKGKTILFGGGPKAMGSYVAPTWILKKNGLVAGKDYTVKFAKNPPSAVIATFNKAASASGSGDIILHVGGVKKRIDTTQMHALATSDPFIHLTWAVSEKFDVVKIKKIQDLMTSLASTPKGKAILKSARVTGFHVAKDSDFTKVREITKYATGEEY